MANLKGFTPGDKVIVTDLAGVGTVTKVTRCLLWVQYPGGVEVVNCLNARAAR